MRLQRIRVRLIGTAAVSLAACGGGGGGGVGIVSTPPPPVTPPPPPPPPPPPLTAQDVRIFANPKTETYATVGIFGGSAADAAEPHIRFVGDHYEIQLPGHAYDSLITMKGFIPQYPSTNSQFQPASYSQNQAFFFTENSRLKGYSYSEIATWAANDIGGGTIAFGSATPSGAVPTTGSASYSGVVLGQSDVTEASVWDYGTAAVAVSGSVNLSFNFGAGTLGGSMSLHTDPMVIAPVDLGTFAFQNTVYSAGGLTYSGSFQTGATGQNMFLGRFTGPNAEETIGAWALPFLYSGDGQGHQAVGAWIAKKP